MKRKTLALPLIGAAFLLGSCGGTTTSSLPSSSAAEETGSSSSQGEITGSSSSSESSSSSSSSSVSEPPLPATAIDEAYLATLASSSFEGKGTLTSYGVTTNIEIFLGPTSLDFYDYDEYGIYYASDLYRKEEDGTTTAYMRDVDNKILSSPLYVDESQTVEAPWDTYFYNPFGKLEAADLTLGENGYAVSAAKVQAFSIPLMHYAVGTFDTATVARLDDTLSITLGATDERGDPMEMKLELAVTTGDREAPAPFETEEYHDAIGKALTAMATLQVATDLTKNYNCTPALEAASDVTEVTSNEMVKETQYTIAESAVPTPNIPEMGVMWTPFTNFLTAVNKGENIDEAATKYQADAVQAIENMH